MFTKESYAGSRVQQYETVIKQLDALLTGESNVVANLSNASALLNQFLDRVNWVGFYVTEGNQLVLGPFQGMPACVRIPFGRGVCGVAAETKTTQLVADVHQFPGHIACDSASNSEIVVPIVKEGAVIGVLDIDSPEKNRFDEVDQRYLEKFVETLLKHM
ncbi:GAF domain-containing protein [Bacillus sp. 22475]|jgi:L-methionine (R)-S-oxide reductase|uniref:GAF domain-containing proteins n=17 Tax=Bacillus cereus group TaxID=86661 RepID=Q817A6_BACCR|nr:MULTISPECIES: GAF domain-containing protein [Bacillus]EAO54956.1 GAF domain-containing proteins [Bacillus thuringiensis serovar israelensis ATCC 35646]MBR3335587.1 GAF domain-containing protein [Bacillus sp. (in: firmicutes)]MCO4215823.1 GAF domain-containing protein [Bacillus sp. 10017]MCX2700476.1 GAF domain-containing protein [Bacillus sp. AS_5]MDV8108270.1 GAF domain-containing protein [Bacillus sp. BAU-SS-2023]MEB4842735.1 GAF domain-containing protein [Paenibacillus jamilae]MED11523